MKAFAATFSNFFNFSLRNDKYAPILEMARPGFQDTGDVVKKPYPFDSEFIGFLKQFPHEFWIEAAQQRMKMLHDKLMELHEDRKSHGYESLEQAIENALKTKDYSSLLNWRGPKGLKLSQDYIDNEIKQANCERLLTDDKKDVFVRAEANKLAFEFIKKHTEGIPEDNNPVDFIFTGQGEYAKTTRISAKPYLNRLYHKLERTEGEQHDPSSGLEGVGEYGYDLSHAKIEKITDPKTKKEIEQPITRGLRWPNAANEQINDLFVLNANHMFGNLREKYPDAVWLPVKNKGGKQVEDTFALDELKNRLTKKITKEFKQTGQSLSGVDLEVNKQINNAINNGELSAMPVPNRPELDRKYHLIPSGTKLSNAFKLLNLRPGASDDDVDKAYKRIIEKQQQTSGAKGGLLPQYIQTQFNIIRNSKLSPNSINSDVANAYKILDIDPKSIEDEDDISYYEKLYRVKKPIKEAIDSIKNNKTKIEDVTGNEQRDNPPLYLPHEKKEIIKNGVKTTEYVPLLLPAHNYRALGTDSWDYKKDPDTGLEQKIDHTNLDSHKVPKEMLRGPKNDYVYLHSSYSDTSYTSDPNRPVFTLGKVAKPELNLGGHQARGSFLFNKEDRKKMVISPCDRNYDKYRYEVIEKQGIYSKPDEQGGPMFKDFATGMMRCLDGGSCAGASEFETTTLKASRSYIHSIIQTHALESLADPSLQTTRGRILLAMNITSSIAERDLGRGTRRKRRLATVDIDAPVQTKGGEISGEEAAFNRSKEDERRDGSATANITRSQGEKLRVAPTDFLEIRPYSLEAIKGNIRQIEAEISALNASKQSIINDGDIKKLEDSIGKTNDLIEDIRSLLIKVFKKDGNADPEQAAEAWIKSQIDANNSDALGLIRALKSDQTIQDMLGADVMQASTSQQSSEQLSPQDQARIASTVQDTVEYLQDKGVTQDQIRANIQNTIQTILDRLEIGKTDPKYTLYKTTIQKDLENRVKLPAPESPTSPSQPPTSPSQPPTRRSGLGSFIRPQTSTNEPETQRPVGLGGSRPISSFGGERDE